MARHFARSSLGKTVFWPRPSHDQQQVKEFGNADIRIVVPELEREVPRFTVFQSQREIRLRELVIRLRALRPIAVVKEPGLAACTLE